MKILERIPLLLKSLRENYWHLTVFRIFYKKNYIVVFEDMKDLPHREKMYSAKLTFIKDDGLNEELEVYANAVNMNLLMGSAVMMRDEILCLILHQNTKIERYLIQKRRNY